MLKRHVLYQAELSGRAECNGARTDAPMKERRSRNLSWQECPDSAEGRHSYQAAARLYRGSLALIGGSYRGPFFTLGYTRATKGRQGLNWKIYIGAMPN